MKPKKATAIVACTAQHPRLQGRRQVAAPDRDHGAEQRQDQHPEQHRALVVAPGAGDLVDQRLRRVRVLPRPAAPRSRRRRRPSISARKAASVSANCTTAAGTATRIQSAQPRLRADHRHDHLHAPPPGRRRSAPRVRARRPCPLPTPGRHYRPKPGGRNLQGRERGLAQAAQAVVLKVPCGCSKSVVSDSAARAARRSRRRRANHQSQTRARPACQCAEVRGLEPAAESPSSGAVAREPVDHALHRRHLPPVLRGVGGVVVAPPVPAGVRVGPVSCSRPRCARAGVGRAGAATPRPRRCRDRSRPHRGERRRAVPTPSRASATAAGQFSPRLRWWCSSRAPK